MKGEEGHQSHLETLTWCLIWPQNTATRSVEGTGMQVDGVVGITGAEVRHRGTGTGIGMTDVTETTIEGIGIMIHGGGSYNIPNGKRKCLP